jgi:cyclopropane-fatty-acyl-phospholipid synthase
MIKYAEKILNEINEGFEEGISVQLPDGIVIGKGKHKVIIKNKKTLDEILRDIEVGFCEGYVRGDIEVQGDLEKVMIAALQYTEDMNNNTLGYYLFNIMRYVLKTMDKLKHVEMKEVQKHYDLSNDFFKLWLDKSMTYSCAFFEKKGCSLEEAQQFKRNIIFEKLQLDCHDTLLDIGCGWGSVILDAAKQYGCKAVGITVSKNQYEYVKEKIKEENLEDLVEVHLMHYQDLPKLNKTFSKIVSVGMFEHVGRHNLKDFFEVAYSMLEPKGLFLLHYIGKIKTVANQNNWITKRIFPGGYLPSLEEVMPLVKETKFGFIDLDNWRRHYYLTLKEWDKRFNEHKEEIIKMLGEEFFRMWELYLLGSAALFYIGSIYLFQILMSKGIDNSYPFMKRKFLYKPF